MSVKTHDGCGSMLILCSASIFAPTECAEPPIRVAEDVFVCGKHCDEYGYEHKSNNEYTI